MYIQSDNGLRYILRGEISEPFPFRGFIQTYIQVHLSLEDLDVSRSSGRQTEQPDHIHRETCIYDD